MGFSKLVVMLFFFLILIIEGCWRSHGCLEHERSALFQLKHFFDESLTLQNWIDDENYLDCCQWERIDCNNATGRVISLDLSLTRNWISREKWYLNASLFIPFQQLEQLKLRSNKIAGCIENEGLERLSKLSNLKILYLSDNYFNNSILSSIGGLLSLRELYLDANSLKGSIDIKEWDSLNNLGNVDMSTNEIDKFVAPKGLSKLKYLGLRGNKLNRSPLSSLTSLSSLRYLDLSDNGFKGSFDVQELDFLFNLEELVMSNNEIDNLAVPNDYRGLRLLNTFYLDGVGTRDVSKLLKSMGSFPSLKTLSLRHNNFTETVTTTQVLHNFTNLEELELDGTSLHISLLQSIAAFTSLKHLSMTDCKLNGVLFGEELHNFTNLEVLHLNGTSLHISFLQSIAAFSSLKYLSMPHCELNGVLSGEGLCDLVHLQVLDISSNDLRGIFPRCLANMTSLRVLDVSFNQLTGKISSSPLIHLTSIEELKLSYNHFQISISLEPFFNHSKLEIFSGESNEVYAETESQSLAPKFQLKTIDLSGHGNGGTFPKFLYHQHELQKVDLSHINLTGEFPNWLLENNTKLESLNLVNNSLSGPLHMPIHPHRQLSRLDVSNNKFQGNIPVEIGAYLPNLMVLNFSRNDFDDSIPSSFGDMKSLSSLDLSNNHLTGEIPEYMAMGCFNLAFLVLSNNNLQGHLFSKNFNLTNLLRLQLDDNHFIGMIPESLSNCSSLGGLYLSDNNFFGRIPTWLGNLSLLQDFIMPNNHLEGPFPEEFCQLHRLKILDLSKNNIYGSLPSCSSFFSIIQVHLSENMLQGLLKDGTFFNSPSLVTLDLSNNRLNGSIPDWIERLTQLNYLILANNSLEGELPIQLCQAKQLRLMDLSYNNLSGQIPPCLDNTSLHEGYYDALDPTYIPPFSIVYYTGNSMGKEENITFSMKERSYSYHGKPLNGMYGIDLSCNKLTGDIPPQIGELNRIRALNLSHNNLTGTIPATFASLKQVESLDLSYNNLNGKIPPQLVGLHFLAVFSVAHNNLSGKIPEWTAQFATFNKNSYIGNRFLCGLPVLKSCNENGLSPPAATPESSTSSGEDNNLIDMDSFYITFTVSYVIAILGIIGVLCVNPYWRRKWFYLIEMWMTSCYYFLVDNLIPTRFCRRYM